MKNQMEQLLEVMKLSYIKPLLGDMSDLNIAKILKDFNEKKQNVILMIQVRGGIDKKPKGKGHRGDTMPICNQIVQQGWIAFPIFYSDEDEQLIKKVLDQPFIQGFILRINPSIVPGVTNQKWRKLFDSYKVKKIVMTLPSIMAKMGSKDALVKISNLQGGRKDTYAYYTVEEWNQKFIKIFQKNPHAVRVIKQNRGSSGEGIWMVKVKNPSQLISKNTVLCLTEAVDNHKQQRTIEDFTKFCQKYIIGQDGLIVDQKFLPRIVEGQIRFNMILDELVSIVHKIPVEGGMSATLDSGAKYISYPADCEKFKQLTQQLKRDLPLMKESFQMKNIQFPLIWTIDYIIDEKTKEGHDTYMIGEINCSCVGITSQLEELAPKVAKAAIYCCTEKLELK